jgi:hypothetical protein
MGINKTSVTKEFKLRGKGGANTPAKTATFEIPEATDLAGALELVGGDEKKVLDYFNAGLKDSIVDQKYNELFGDEVKMNQAVKSLVDAGVPEELARESVRKMFNERPSATPAVTA